MLKFVRRNLNEFKEFAVKGNVIDMAVGIIIGASFGSVVNSLVNDIIMPPLGFLMGKVDFSNMYLTIYNPNPEQTYSSLKAAANAGVVTLNYGLFINTIISFIIVAYAVFLLIKAINKLKNAAEKQCKSEAAAAEPATKECPRCFSKIDAKATKCPYCTADI